MIWRPVADLVGFEAGGAGRIPRGFVWLRLGVAHGASRGEAQGYRRFLCRDCGRQLNERNDGWPWLLPEGDPRRAGRTVRTGPASTSRTVLNRIITVSKVRSDVCAASKALTPLPASVASMVNSAISLAPAVVIARSSRLPPPIRFRQGGSDCARHHAPGIK
jgi:hypothetical protein